MELNSMTILKRLIFTAIALLITSGCALKGGQHNLVTFHEGKLPRGETISIEPVDSLSPDSLEFSYYRVLMADKLRKLGYTPVSSDEPATLVAKVDYSVSDGQKRIGSEQRSGANYIPRNLSNYPSKYPSKYYARYHFHNGRHHSPFYYGYSNQWPPENYSDVVYNRILEINILDRSTTERLFEGRAQSIGREKEIASAMPYMITAMFNNFPGENGITKVVTID